MTVSHFLEVIAKWLSENNLESLPELTTIETWKHDKITSSLEVCLMEVLN